VATGHVAEAAELVAQMQADIAAAVAAVPVFESAPSYYHELDPTFYSVTSNTFIGQVYALFGLRNIADTAEAGNDYPQLSAEFLISQDPDLIFLADTKCCGESVDTVGARPGWERSPPSERRPRDRARRRRRVALGTARGRARPADRRQRRRHRSGAGGLTGVGRSTRPARDRRPAPSDRAHGQVVAAALVGVLLAAALFLGVMIGPAGELGCGDWNIIWNVRMPRVVLAGIVGAMLSLAGASYQGVFRNPLVDPYLLGVAAGAGLGRRSCSRSAARARVGWLGRPAAAGRVRRWAARRDAHLPGRRLVRWHRSGVTLVLAGVAVTSLATAIQAFVLQRNSDVIREVYSWILGRLTLASWHDVRLVLPYVVVSSTVLLLHRRHLDVLRVGDDEAIALGTDVATGASRRRARSHHGHRRRGQRQRAHRLRRHRGAAPRAACWPARRTAGAAAQR
jgi:ABC-type cobalamin transport system permease subunit